MHSGSIIPRLSCVGENRAWYTLFAHAQFLQDDWGFGNSRKICSITLTSMRHTNFSHINDTWHCLRCVYDEEATKVLIFLLAGIVHVFVHSS